MLGGTGGRRQASTMIWFLVIVGATTVSSFTTTTGCKQQGRPGWVKHDVRFQATVAPADAAAEESATNDDNENSAEPEIKSRVLESITAVASEAKDYAEQFGLDQANAAMFAYFAALRQHDKELLGMTGQSFVTRHDELLKAMNCNSTGIPGFFTMSSLEKAVQDDFLDAARGSTDNRKGWRITDVSQPRGDSFEEARMTFDDVQAALEKGTVIMNAAGAHIPLLAGPSLATTDATSLPCALNLYVTAAHQRTSAPPHTDKQDVAVVQTQGRKGWKVFQPPNPALKPQADVFARGKGDDSLPLYSLDANDLVVETILNPGDILYIPAGFPHTTSTVLPEDGNSDEESIHLTLGIDHHIWELDYLNARKFALARAGVVDTALPSSNPFVGKVNELPEPTRSQLLGELPLGLLEEDKESMIDEVAAELERISRAVDETTASAVESTIWKDTIARVRQEGMELLETHRNMYLAALEEGEARAAEDAMTAHLDTTVARKTLSPERIQRLSLFRVKKYFDEINASKDALKAWSQEGAAKAAGSADSASLPSDWAFSLPVKVGDQVEADLGGAFFAATVTRCGPNDTYDVQFFDGDRETGLPRSMIKLQAPPKQEAEIDTSSMTPKQLKRWKKQQAKKNKGGKGFS